MTLTVCGVVDTGFAASACWQPAEKTELTANKMATMIRKLVPPFSKAEAHQDYFQGLSDT